MNWQKIIDDEEESGDSGREDTRIWLLLESRYAVPLDKMGG